MATLCMCAIHLYAATDSHITGHVLDAATQEHLGYINVQLQGTTIGCTTDESGHFFLKNLPLGSQIVVFSFVGYKTKEVPITIQADSTYVLDVAIEETSYLLDNVVVSANKYASKQKEVTTIVNVISPLVIENTASNSMADVLNFQPGLRVEMSCCNCGVPQLRINGLEGQYSQILLDSRPIFSSLASVYGLEQIPTGMVDCVEVIRGGCSALFGANAIGGVVNIITKEPCRNYINLSYQSAFTETGSFDINTNMNASVLSPNEKIGLYLFGVRRDRKQYDRDGDGYSDIPKLQTTTLGFRSFFKTSDYSKITLEYHHTTEFRRGGYGIDSLQPHESPLTEQLKHNIDAGSLRWDYYTADNRHSVTPYVSFQHTARESYFGTNYNPNAYGQSRDITAVMGGQYRFSYPCGKMPADLSAGIEYSFNQLHDQILGYNRNLWQTVHLYGGYVQNEWKNTQWSILIGGRLEKHNLLKKPIFTPRASVRYTPIKDLILRVGYASGYRAPQTYDEDLHVGAVGGEVHLISLDPNLKEERSHSATLSIDWYKSVRKWDINFTAEGFFTQLNNVFALREDGHDEQGNLLLTRVNASGARVAGVNVEGKIGYGRLFTLQLGYTYEQSRYIEDFQWSPTIAPQRRMFRTPDHYGFFIVNVHPVKGLNITTNGKVTGNMLVQHYAGYIPQDEEVETTPFFEWDIKLAYEIPLYKNYTLEISAGVKNLLDQYQKDLDKGMNKDASYIYGPFTPRSYFVGLNLKI
ncbi:MAG: TonB-dependent receptor [Paludibacteraceae bacterium]|nr:TonB-dependent receptor [Paludibacteraceae bacterium]